MATVILPILWIAFDVCICVRTAFMTKPMSLSEIVGWGFVGFVLGLTALWAGWSERERAHEQEIKYERDRADLRGQIADSSGYNRGAFMSIDRRLEEFAALSPQNRERVTAVKAELAEIPMLTPEIVYDSFDERIVRHNDGRSYKYTHLFFRNEPTGSVMLDAAARIEIVDYVYGIHRICLVDAKWQDVSYKLGPEIRAANKIDMLPNRSSHPLDLAIRAPNDSDCYVLHVESPMGWQDERYRLTSGMYRARVTLSSRGYSKDFWFQIWNDGQTVKVHELEFAADGASFNAKDEVRR